MRQPAVSGPVSVVAAGMSPISLSGEALRWLQNATAGLPLDVSAVVQAEFIAHIEDAMEEYMDQGMSESEAQRRALHDLGAAEAVAQGMNDVHRGRRTYLSGFWASLSVLVALFGTPALYQVLGLSAADLAAELLFATGQLLLLSLTLVALMAFRCLLTWHAGLPVSARLIQIIGGGLVVSVVTGVVLMLRTGLEGEVQAIGDADGAFETLLVVLVQAGQIAGGSALVLLAARMIRHGDSLYGLGKPLALTVLLLGGGLAITGLLWDIGLDVPGDITYMLVMLAHVLLWPVMTLVFFRALYRSPINPVQAA